MKVLNLYAGIGGNRKLWGGVEVTAVENDIEILDIYTDLYPNDKYVLSDAHKYLKENYEKYDFIWTSPPCQTHSQIRYNLGFKNRGTKAVYPDMKLYEEILFLKGYFKGKWVVENVISWYEPLIKPYEAGRHYFWSNFNISNKKEQGTCHSSSISSLIAKRKGIDDNFKINNKVKIIRNCVNPSLGLHIFNCAFKIKQLTLNQNGM